MRRYVPQFGVRRLCEVENALVPPRWSSRQNNRGLLSDFTCSTVGSCKICQAVQGKSEGFFSGSPKCNYEKNSVPKCGLFLYNSSKRCSPVVGLTCYELISKLLS